MFNLMHCWPAVKNIEAINFQLTNASNMLHVTDSFRLGFLNRHLQMLKYLLKGKLLNDVHKVNCFDLLKMINFSNFKSYSKLANGVQP